MQQQHLQSRCAECMACLFGSLSAVNLLLDTVMSDILFIVKCMCAVMMY